MEILNYNDEEAKIIEILKRQKTTVLSTSANDKVTARTVHCVFLGLKAYIVTSSAYQKYKQIVKNANVALCFDNIQIVGKARALGHPEDKANASIFSEIKKSREEFLRWTKYKNSVLLEIDIVEIECWKNNGRKYISVENKKAYKIG